MEHLKLLMTSNPKIFAMLLEWCDDKTETLDCYRLRNMEDFDSTFDGLTDSEYLRDYLR